MSYGQIDTVSGDKTTLAQQLVSLLNNFSNNKDHSDETTSSTPCNWAIVVFISAVINTILTAFGMIMFSLADKSIRDQTENSVWAAFIGALIISMFSITVHNKLGKGSKINLSNTSNKAAAFILISGGISTTLGCPGAGAKLSITLPATLTITGAVLFADIKNTERNNKKDAQQAKLRASQTEVDYGAAAGGTATNI